MKWRHSPVSNIQIGSASLQGVRKGVIKSRVKATGNFSDEETSLAQLSHSHSVAHDARGATRTRSELLQTVKQEPPVELEWFSAARDVFFSAK